MDRARLTISHRWMRWWHQNHNFHIFFLSPFCMNKQNAKRDKILKDNFIHKKAKLLGDKQRIQRCVMDTLVKRRNGMTKGSRRHREIRANHFYGVHGRTHRPQPIRLLFTLGARRRKKWNCVWVETKVMDTPHYYWHQRRRTRRNPTILCAAFELMSSA